MPTYPGGFIGADGLAHLYPYADRADSPRVAGKYRTVDVASIRISSQVNLDSEQLPN